MLSLLTNLAVGLLVLLDPCTWHEPAEAWARGQDNRASDCHFWECTVC
jgi:hypothetical protein